MAFLALAYGFNLLKEVTSMLYAFSAFLAYFVKGLCGFANTLVFSSILSFWQDNIYITPIDLPLSLISNLLLVFHDHKALSVKIWGSGAFS